MYILKKIKEKWLILNMLPKQYTYVKTYFQILYRIDLKLFPKKDLLTQ